MASRREQAGLPSYPAQRWATLQAMKEMKLPATNDEISEALADALQLSPEQRSVMHVGDRTTEVSYCAAWARTGLRAAGAIDRVSRALWTVTSEGRFMSPETIEERYAGHLARRAEENSKLNKPTTPGGENAGPVSLDEDMLPDLDWKEALLQHVSKMSPQGFEHLSGALLEAAGFHGVKVTGQSGDGGIDVVAVYRPQGLVSFRTTVQCKRWTGGVGSDRVQAFQGASMGKADRGILITTGHFTPAARTQAQAPGAFPIDLVDGDALCDLLREYSLGVRTIERRVEDIVVDDTYFAQFEDSQ